MGAQGKGGAMERGSRIGVKLLLGAGLLLLALLVGPYLIPVRPPKETRSPEELADPDSRFVQVDGLCIHYKEMGQGEPAIILLHGFGASTFSWRRVLAPLSRLGRTLAYDRPGFGLTHRPRTQGPGESPYSLEAQSRLLFQLMDRLGIQRAILVGNSMGGVVAAQAALTHPERVAGLVLVDAAIHLLRHIPGWLHRVTRIPQVDRLGPLLARPIAHIGGQRLLLSSWHNRERLTPEVWEGYMRALAAENWDYGLWQTLRTRGRPEVVSRLGELRVPTLVITGEHDAVVPTAHSLRLAQEIPGARLVVIPDCGHLPQEEQPEAFLQAVSQFVEAVSPHPSPSH